MKQVRVLVVDDSATMRKMIALALSSDPSISVVGEAADPLAARQAIKALNPDVVTLDVEMPHMNGLEFLDKIMRLRPMPVVMVSTKTERGAEATIKALEIGAVDCVAKPSANDPTTFDGLCSIVQSAARARVGGNRPVLATKEARPETAPGYVPDGKIVAVGASTGGVEALLTLFSKYPKNCPPTVVTLHMPTPFTRSFAQRLDGICAARVTEAVHGAPIEPGHVYLAPGSTAHLEVMGSSQPRCQLRAGDPVSGHRPSVDALFLSVARAQRGNAVGVILTGMGRDGAQGLLEMRRAGARTIGQDEASSLIYGMPKAAFECQAVEKQVSLMRVTDEILSLTAARK